jgi:hypothetical protein
MQLTRKQQLARIVIATLTCGHSRDYRFQYVPADFELVWCYQCHAMRQLGRVTEEYKVACESCRYSRRMGQARLQGERNASAHHNRNPSHIVRMWHGPDLHHEWKPQVEALPESFTISLPSGGLDTFPF